MLRAHQAALAALLACASGSLGCEDGANPYFGTSRRVGKSPSVFYVNGAAEPQYIDPGRTSEAIGTLIINHIYEGLSVYDPRDSHPTQGVASSWEKSDDNRLFRFHLRPEARWSDGKRVTADDFVFAWSRELSPKLASSAATDLYVLFNAEPYFRGFLKATQGAAPVRDAASAGAAVKATLPSGTAVRVLKTEGDYSQIAPHTHLPTFDPDIPSAPTEKKPPEPLGWVETKGLGLDPSLLGIRAVSDDILEVETEGPTPYLLDLTCYSALAPLRRDIVEPLEKSGKVDELNRPGNLVLNGPFTITDWKFHYEMVMTKNPTYWRAAEVKLERVVWMMVEDYRSTMNLYKAGELDYLGDNVAIPPELLPFAAKKKDFTQSYFLSTYWYEFNVTKPPVNDVRVRHALSLAIDKQQLIDRVTGGRQIPATHYVPDFTGSGYSAVAEADKKAGTDPFSGKGMGFDPEQGRALLREAGYDVVEGSDGFQARGFPPLELLYNTNEGNRAIAVAIQDFWRKNLGVTANLRNEEWKVMLKSVDDGNFQVVRLGWVASYNHPQTWLDTFLSYSPQNRTRWADPELDAMLKDAARTSDVDASIRKFRAAEKRIVDAMPKIPLYFSTKNTLVKPWVRGLYPNPRNVHLAQWLWIDETSQSENRPAAEPRDYPPPGRFVKSRGGEERRP